MPTIPKSFATRLFLAVLAVGIATWLGYRTIARPCHTTWGTTDAERRRPWPGDDLIPAPRDVTTRAITIHAPADRVWPWLAQLGADKGGLYSYTGLERLIGCPLVNADRIHPEWQAVQPGDKVRLCPGADVPPPYEVIDVQPNRALVLGHRLGPNDPPVPDSLWFDTWAFLLDPVDAGTTRLLVHTRSSQRLAWQRVIEPGVFVMEYGLLHGVQARAETRQAAFSRARE